MLLLIQILNSSGFGTNVLIMGLNMALTTAVSSTKSAINAGTFCFVYFFYYLLRFSFSDEQSSLNLHKQISFFSLSM